MAKRPNLTDITNVLNSASTHNTNNDEIELAFDNTLSRDGSTPNQMEADLDLNSNDLLNAGVVNASDVLVAGVKLVPASATPDWKSAWVTATSYVKDDLVREDGSSYIAITAHTSGTFATDLGGGLWELFSQRGDPGLGDMVAANNLSDVTSPSSSRTNIGAASQVDLDTVTTTANAALPKTGGTMTGDVTMDPGAQFVGSSGDSAVVPSFTWGGQQALMGMYAVSAGVIGFAVAGVEAARVSPAGTSAPDATTIMTREKVDARFTTRAPIGSATVISSPAATAEFTLDTTTYRKFVLEYEGVVPVTNNARLLLQFSPDGGSTWRTAGYNSNTTQVGGTDVTTEGIFLGYNVSNTASHGGAGGCITVFSAGVAGVYTNGFAVAVSNQPTVSHDFSSGGAYQTAESHDMMRIIFTTGNIASAANVQLYGFLA